MSEYIEEPDTIRNELIDNGALSDKRMNEYIITCDEETAAWIGNDVDSMRPIVRCRDCRWAKPDHSDHEYRGEYRCNMWIADVDAYGFCFRAWKKEGGE